MMTHRSVMAARASTRWGNRNRRTRRAHRNVGQRAKEVLADAGYASEENLKALERRKIKGYVALGREGKKARTPNPKAHATNRMA